MDTLTATFRIVTPMFMAGADQSKAELRVPSIKGALRFWWRALNWASIQNEAGNTESALKLLSERESNMFGNADTAGQSKILMTVSTAHNLTTQAPPALHSDLKPSGHNRNSMAGARYLGYGLIVPFDSSVTKKKSGQLERACIDADQKFTIRMVGKQIPQSITDALILFGLLGGIGSRSRRGFGSVMLEKIEINDEDTWSSPNTIKEYEQRVCRILEKYHCLSCASEPPFSAFSQHSRVDKLINTNSYDIALNQFGLRMLDYRSWGQSKNNNVLPSGKTSEKRFADDHDWYRKGRNWRNRHRYFHPKRVVFGLPHNYSKQEDDHVTPKNHDRRASPLMFHVHQLGHQYIGVAVFLRSHFLPDEEKIYAGEKDVQPNIDWRVITEFLEGKTGYPPSDEDRFPEREVIFP